MNQNILFILMQIVTQKRKVGVQIISMRRYDKAYKNNKQTAGA